MSGFNDPFSPAGSDVPAANGGVSPDFWRNLMMFGGNMAAAANARTPQGFLQYGSGFAGPFGAALSQTAQSSMEVPQLRSRLGLNQAQTEDIRSQAASRNIHNKLDLYNLNFNSSVMGGPQFDEQGNVLPPGVQSPYSWGGQQQSQAQPQPSSSGLSKEAFLNNVQQRESGGQNIPTQIKNSDGTPASSATGLYQIISPTWQEGKALAGIPAGQYDTAMAAPSAVQRQVASALYDKYGETPWAASAPKGVQLAQAGNGPFPMPSGGGQQQAPQQQQIDPRSLLQSIYQRQRSISTLTPQEAGAIAPFLHNINPQLGQELAGYALAGPKAGSVQAAELPYVGPKKAAEAANSNVDIRTNGLSKVMHADGTFEWVKNPGVEQTQDAQGSTVPMHVSPPLPGSPPGTPGEATPIMGPDGKPIIHKLPQQVQDARNKAFQDFTGKDTDTFTASQNTQAWLEQMNHAADTLNKNGGFLGTGPTNQARVAFASNVNDFLRSAGLKEAFDPTQLAAWEELKKATTTAGFELSSHYEGHARQAAQTIMNATSAVPAATNSPVGFKTVSAGIQEMAQQQVDLHNFKQQIYDQVTQGKQPAGTMAQGAAGTQGDIASGEVAFYKNNPSQMYARRAISSVTPYTVSDDKQLSRYLPGTFLSYKGHVVQVPERQGAPPIPDYLKNMQPPVVQNGG